MSSSRIIKSGEAAGQTVRSFNFEALAGEAVVRDAVDGAGGFVPFLGMPDTGQFSGKDPACDDARAGAGETGADLAAEELQQPGIPEDEVNERVMESYERGYEEGQRQAEKGLSNVFKSLRGAIEEINSLREQIFRDSEEDLLKLAILVARKIIQQEINDDRRILAKVVAAALENSSERGEIIVRLNPEDYRLVSSHKQLYLNAIGNDRIFELKSDDAVSLGGCVVDTVMGEIDARLETQLDEIYRRLLDERGDLLGFSRKLLTDGEQHVYEES